MESHWRKGWYFLTLLLLTALVELSRCDTSADEQLSEAANCFTLEFYKKLAKEQDSLVCSPFSLDVLLSMLLSGAGGTTAQEMKQALGYDTLSLEDMQDAFQSKLGKLTSSDGNTLNIANSVWIQENFPVKQSFKDIVVNMFYSEIQNLDFAGHPSESTSEINSWGNEKTNGLIPVLFDDDLSRSTVMVLVNAIYFKGNWKYQFSKNKTQPANFNNNDSTNNSSTVEFMNQRADFKYKMDTTLNAQVLEMDYAGEKMSMVLILPGEGSNLDSLEQRLKCETLKDGISSLFSTEVDVTIPKFELSSTFDLINAITEQGINEAFTPGANFSGIADDIAISKAIQKAKIKVYEEGSEAAVLTGIGVVGTTSVGGGPKIIYFKADHPFFYVIRDKRTNLILFIGRVKNLKNAA